MPNEINGTPIQGPAVSTTTPLESSTEWTSPAIGNVNGTVYLYGSAYGDQDFTVVVEYSDDGENWVALGDGISVTASTLAQITAPMLGALVRINVSNGGEDDQTELRVFVYTATTFINS